jgi:monoterpene epsilon-lactone hydrolase
VPSLRHELLAHTIPRLRKAGELDEPEAERSRLDRWHATPELVGRTLPSGLVPRFDKRFEVTTSDVGFPIHTIRRRGTRPRSTVYYVHGGGYVAPTDAIHVRYALRLAAHLDADVVLPDYPLAPGHTWRDSHDVMREGLAALTSTQDRVVVAGDSAGGGLALGLVQSLRDRGHAPPSHVVLHSPWVDLTTSTPETYVLDAIDPWLFIGKLETYAGWWSGDPADLARPEVSPALGDLAGLPPMLVTCGTRDLLVPGCRLLVDRATAAGARLTYLEAPDLIHVFAILPGLPEARRAWRHTTEFLA